MSSYNVVLFVHLLGVVAFFSAIAFVQRGGAGLRGAETLDQVRLWLGVVRTTQLLWPVGLGLILLSGLYMADQAWTFATPWVATAIASVLLMGAVGGGIVGRTFARMGRAAEGAGNGPPSRELTQLIRAPLLWVSMSALNGGAIGLLWLMATKPGWTISIAVPACLAVLGGLAGFGLVRRHQAV